MKKNNILLFILFVILHLDVFSHTQNIILEKNEKHFISMVLAFFAASDGIVLENNIGYSQQRTINLGLRKSKQRIK